MKKIAAFALLALALSVSACTQAAPSYGSEWDSMKYTDYAAMGAVGSLPTGK